MALAPHGRTAMVVRGALELAISSRNLWSDGAQGAPGERAGGVFTRSGVARDMQAARPLKSGVSAAGGT